MTDGLRALTLAFLLLGAAPVVAQERDPVRPETGAPSAPPPEPGTTKPRPDVREQLLRDLFQVVLQPPRQQPPPPEVDLPAPMPAEVVPEPAPPVVTVLPTIPQPAPAGAALPPVRPAPAAATTVIAPPRRAQRPVWPKPPAAAVPQPVPEVAPSPELSPPPVPPEPAPHPAEIAVRPAPSAQPQPPPPPEPERTPWLLLALAALAATAGGAAYKLREHRRLGRTKAALGLSPSLDPAEGSGSASPLSLAKPPIAIRTRLEWA